jgi:hypothetical protein
MNDFMQSKAYEQLRMHAISENSPVLYAMLQSYNYQPDRWASAEDFLADTVLALATALSGTQAQCVDLLSRTSPIHLCANCGQSPVNWK